MRQVWYRVRLGRYSCEVSRFRAVRFLQMIGRAAREKYIRAGELYISLSAYIRRGFIYLRYRDIFVDGRGNLCDWRRADEDVLR